VRRCVETARADGVEVRAEFNGVDVVATPTSTEGDVRQAWSDAMERKAREWRESPAGKQAAAEGERRQREERERAATTTAKLAIAPPIALRDPDWWATAVRVNSDPYGGAAIRFSERWARLMQVEMAAGSTLPDCADKASSAADAGIGITGFMYGCAVSILAQCWEHGEELRRWHNLKTQVRDEGERANESGGVLNPALLTIGPPTPTDAPR